MENFFASEQLPEGYKLMVEEDTGECFIIMTRNDTVNQTGSEIEQQNNGSQPGWESNHKSIFTIQLISWVLRPIC